MDFRNASLSARLLTFSRSHWQKLIAGGVWLALLISYFLYARANQLGPLQILGYLIDALRANTLGALLYVIIYALRSFTFFSAGLLSIAGGFLFGPPLGLLYVTIASNLSAIVSYLIGYYFGQEFYQAGTNQQFTQRYTDRLRKNSFETVLLLRLLLMPFDVVNYLCGILRIDFRSYVLGNIFGMIPGSIAFVLFGASIDNVEEWLIGGKNPTLDWRVLALSLVLFAASLVFSRYLKKRDSQ